MVIIYYVSHFINHKTELTLSSSFLASWDVILTPLNATFICGAVRLNFTSFDFLRENQRHEKAKKESYC
ncbi:hypothetical protein X975_06609, partial [Stegodyphus mimosarum]